MDLNSTRLNPLTLSECKNQFYNLFSYSCRITQDFDTRDVFSSSMNQPLVVLVYGSELTCVYEYLTETTIDRARGRANILGVVSLDPPKLKQVRFFPTPLVVLATSERIDYHSISYLLNPNVFIVHIDSDFQKTINKFFVARLASKFTETVMLLSELKDVDKFHESSWNWFSFSKL